MIQYQDGVLTVIEACDRVRITKGKHTAHADVNGVTQLPLAYGDGVYTVETFKRVREGRYDLLKSRKIDVKGTKRYMLLPNLYVPYYTLAWDKAKGLLSSSVTPGGVTAYRAVRDWVKKSIVYDHVRAATIPKKNVLPDPERCFDKRMGICQDIASLMVGMLRAVNVPSRLVIGWRNGKYHAWVESETGGKTYRYDPTKEIMNEAGTYKYTKERWY